MGENLVITKSGKIRGVTDGKVKIFKGIPYAAPPIGTNRFMPPKLLEPWHNILDAQEFGPIAPQDPSPPEISKLHLPVDEAGCLTLNIWTPATDNKKRPVMFWIHGGSFEIGSGAEYDGGKLAARGDVVVVTINYRLGIFGFLYVPGKTANVGMLDQIAALRWVKQNISSFGGDPANITVFGESAGAHSISVLMTMPQAKGLFNRAILQSSGCSSLYHKGSGGEAVGKSLFSKLGINYSNMETLREIPVEALQSTYQQIKMTTSPFDFLPPFVDGDTIPIHPFEAINNGYAVDIEVLAGFNTNEASLFSLWDPEINKLTEEGLRQRMEFFFMMIMGLKYDAQVAQRFYNFYLRLSSSQTLRQVWENFYTDLMFRVPLKRFLELQTRYQPHIYAYEFAWRTPELGGLLGAPHALDLYFIFDTFEDKPFGIYPARNLEIEKFSRTMMDAWINFARCGNPNHKGMPVWSEYNTNSESTMLFDKELRVETGRYSNRDKIWQGIL